MSVPAVLIKVLPVHFWLQYIASCWNHDGDPVQLLKISEDVARFRQALKDNPRFLQDKVQHYFKVRECFCTCELHIQTCFQGNMYTPRYNCLYRTNLTQTDKKLKITDC